LTKPFHIEADSSNFATHTILSQISSEMRNGTQLHSFLSSFPWWNEIMKEMLAIIQFLQEWRHFVEGAEHQCEIWIDHKTLEYFMMAKQLNWRQA